MEAEQRYTKLNVERYGGIPCASWFDRPLSVAGRVIAKENGGIVQKLVNIDRDLLLIPSLAIHMNREANDGYKYNFQTDLLPLLGDETAKGSFTELVAEAAGVRPGNIIGEELFLYNRQAGTIWGGRRGSICPARGWITWRAHGLRWRVSPAAGAARMPAYSAYSTMKRWGAPRSRGQRPHS